MRLARRDLDDARLLTNCLAYLLVEFSGYGFAPWPNSGSGIRRLEMGCRIGGLLTAGAKQLLEHRSDQRLRLDAAMRAGALLTPTKDAPVSSAAAASGLLVLTELGRSDLAVALLVDLWPGDAIDEVSLSKETAILVINAALKSGATQPSAPLVAAELLCRHADTLDPASSTITSYVAVMPRNCV